MSGNNSNSKSSYDKSTNVRKIAYEILIEVFDYSNFYGEIINGTLSKYQYLQKVQRSYISRVTRGVIERNIELDYIISKYSKTPLKKMDSQIINILRLGIYEIKYMDSIRCAATCNECVKLVPKKLKHLKGFVNGILRNVSRTLEDIDYQEDWIKYSIPKWMFDMFAHDYGYDKTIEIANAFLRKSQLSIRTNLHISTPERVQKCLEKQGVKVTPVEELDYAFYIDEFDYLEDLEAFNKGMFYVQDVSSMMVASNVKPKAGDMILDVCAAPGGKSLHFAELLKFEEKESNALNKGKVFSRDLTENKVDLINENIKRTSLDNVETLVWDATVLDKTMINAMDIVVCDLPCSGLGVIGKKPDIKLNIKKEDIDSLSNLQKQILNISKEYVKSGGKLVFSTCTINKKENDENVKWFLEENSGFKLLEKKQYFPCNKHDGFFISVFEKIVI